jgi:cell division protein FtsI/penicillin-binding protein 2
MPRHDRTRIGLLATAALLSLGAAPAATSSVPPEEPAADPLAGISPGAMRLEDGRYRQHLEDGRIATFTVDPALQGFADGLLARNDVPAGAAVVLHSRTGRVLAFSTRRRDEAPDGIPVALDPAPPAASLFKIVTTAALLERGGLPADAETCYHGGSRSLREHHLEDSPEADSACVSLAGALGRSTNAVFAKLSDRHLGRADLEEFARRFGFNRPLPFDVPLAQSPAEIPEDRLERARAAAGFWHTHLSPLHAAMISQAVAQGGAMLRPYLVESVSDAEGRTLHEAEPAYVGRVASKETAASLLEAMTQTVERGTAREAFRDDAGRPLLPGIRVAGKTGTLHGHDPFRAYSWFVGVAPVERPEVAIAVLIVNEPKWRIKSAPTAALILKKYFELADR